jgi:hypothetical protein
VEVVPDTRSGRDRISPLLVTGERCPATVASTDRDVTPVLYCDECGCCSGEFAKGWTAFRCDAESGFDLAFYCPPCAAAEFGHRSAVAGEYVRIWEPQRDPETANRRSPNA